MSEINFNNLLAEWLDTLDIPPTYQRRKDGTFEWIDWCTWAGEDFDKFVKEKMKK